MKGVETNPAWNEAEDPHHADRQAEWGVPVMPALESDGRNPGAVVNEVEVAAAHAMDRL